MSFRIAGLDPALFTDVRMKPATVLAAKGVERVRVQAANSAPCRVSLDDADVGENVLLLSYDHQPATTPYQQQGPIFVREAGARFEGVGIVPPALERRTLSLRGFDRFHMMIEADLVEGAHAQDLIARFFANRQVDYIHAHYARRGCFAARIDRA